MFLEIFKPWKKTKAMTLGEIAVLRKLLPLENPNSAFLFRQATNAPYVERKRIGTNGYQVTIPYITDDSLFYFENSNYDSPPLELKLSSGLDAIFSTKISSCFLFGLIGKCDLKNSWPKNWEILESELSKKAEIENWFPFPMDQKEKSHKIELIWSWCDLNYTIKNNEKFKNVFVFKSAKEVDIQRCESRLQIKLCSQYKELLAITNGLKIRHKHDDYEIFGSKDISFIGENKKWLIIEYPHSENVIAVSCENGIMTEKCFEVLPNGSEKFVGDLKKYIRQKLICL